MLFLVILAIALLKAGVVFTLGFLLAVGVWLLGKALRLDVPAWIRWGGVAVLLAILGTHFAPDLLSLDDAKAPTRDVQDGWALLQFQTEQTCVLLALFGLGATGVLLSLIRGILSLVRRPAGPPPIPGAR